VTQIRAVEGFGVADGSGRLFERDSVLAEVDCGLARVLLEHYSVYKLGRAR
jgi:hypothetical protein